LIPRTASSSKRSAFGALWNVFPKLLHVDAESSKGVVHGQGRRDVFKRIETFDFRLASQFGTGDQAERSAGDELKATLLIAYQSDGDAPTSIKLFDGEEASACASPSRQEADRETTKNLVTARTWADIRDAWISSVPQIQAEAHRLIPVLTNFKRCNI